MPPIIQVSNLSKKFSISHEQQDRYSSLRDVVSGAFRRTFSSSRNNEVKPSTKEEFWALKDINFQIHQGDRVGIIGRNGAGKSTLLKILSRITEPTTGRVTIDGRVASLLEVGTGFHPELTGRENIFLNGAILGMSRAEIRSKFDEIVAFAEIEKFLDTPVKRYSSGMYVRLAFAVAAHLEPEILIVDEVLAVGDAQFQKKCLGKMEDVSRTDGRTVLFVSHNLAVVSQLCPKAILLDKGCIVNQGFSEEVIQAYNGIGERDVTNYSNIYAEDYCISKVETVSLRGGSVFDFSESIRILIEINNPRSLNGLHLGVALLDKWKRKLFTSVHQILKKSDSDLEVFELTIPDSLLLSGIYSLDVSSFVPNGATFSYVKDICSFSVEDYISEMSIYGSADTGVIYMNCLWK